MRRLEVARLALAEGREGGRRHLPQEAAGMRDLLDVAREADGLELVARAHHDVGVEAELATARAVVEPGAVGIGQRQIGDRAVGEGQPARCGLFLAARRWLARDRAGRLERDLRPQDGNRPHRRHAHLRRWGGGRRDDRRRARDRLQHRRRRGDIGLAAGDGAKAAAVGTVAQAAVAEDQGGDPAPPDVRIDGETRRAGETVLAAEEVGRRLAAGGAEMRAPVEAHALDAGIGEGLGRGGRGMRRHEHHGGDDTGKAGLPRHGELLDKSCAPRDARKRHPHVRGSVASPVATWAGPRAGCSLSSLQLR